MKPMPYIDIDETKKRVSMPVVSEMSTLYNFGRNQDNEVGKNKHGFRNSSSSQNKQDEEYVL